MLRMSSIKRFLKTTIYISELFGTGIGTATNRAGSGTVEEYELAKARHDKDPNSIELMLYFKDALPLSRKELDAKQFAAVDEFRERVKKGNYILQYPRRGGAMNEDWLYDREGKAWELYAKVTAGMSSFT